MKTYINVALFVLLLTASCKKVLKEADKDPANCPIKELNTTDNAYSSKIKLYYTGGKITKTEYLEGAVIQEINNYKYEADKITVSNETSSGDKVTYVYTLNNNRVISALVTSPATYKLSATYTYDAQGYIINATTKIGTTTHNYNATYTGGNLTKLDGSSSPINYNALEPYQDILAMAHPLTVNDNFLEEFTDWIIISQGYFGTNPKNLISSQGTNTYTYTKDSNGKITDVVKAYSLGVEKSSAKRGCD